MFNVKKYFGATGDGSSDDTLALVDAANSGLSPIFFPPGEYAITPGDWIFPKEHQSISVIGSGKMRANRTASKWYASRIVPAPGATTDATLKKLPLLTDLSEGSTWENLGFRGLEYDTDPSSSDDRLERLVLLRGSDGHPNFQSRWVNCSFQYATYYGMRIDTREHYDTVSNFTMQDCWFERITNKNFLHDSTDATKQMADAFRCDNEQAISIFFYGFYASFVDRCFNVNAGGGMAVYGGGIAVGRVILRTGWVDAPWHQPDAIRHVGLASNTRGMSINDFKADAQGPRIRLVEDVKNSASASTQGRVGGMVTFNRLWVSGSQALGKNTDGALEDEPTAPFVTDRPMVENYGGQCVVLRDCYIPDVVCKASSDSAGDGSLALLDSGDAGSGRVPALLLENVVDLKHESEMGGDYTFEKRYLQFIDTSASDDVLPEWSAVNVYRISQGLEGHAADGQETNEGVYLGGDLNVWTESEKDELIADVTQLVDLEEGDRVIVVGSGGALELHRKQKTTKALLQEKQMIKTMAGSAETDPDQSPGQVVT